MVVADEDPPRKRSRLSLKAKKGENTPLTEDSEPPPLDSAGTAPQGPVLKSEEEVRDCSPPVIDLTESDLPCDRPGVPPVASMENLGNTCFLNSVLEVLRYTPCFLEGLEELYRHIVYLEKVKSCDVVQESEEVKTDPVLAWDLVKNMFKMYKKMEKREEMFMQFANADVTSMAIKPDKVLDVIREFNPMFEGHMQHDAQEVLRCLLCYLEDSEKELHSDYATLLALHPALLKTPGPHTPVRQDNDRQINGNAIMDKFLAAGKLRQRRGKSAIAALRFDQPPSDTTPSESGDSNDPRSEVNSAHNDDPRSELNGSTRFKRPSLSLNKPDILDAVARGCKEGKVPESAPETKKRKFQHSRLKKVVEKEECDEVDCMGRKSASPDIPSATLDNESDRKEEEEETGSSRVRRSARQQVQNKRFGELVSKNNALKSRRTCGGKQAKEASQDSDSKYRLDSEAAKRSEKSENDSRNKRYSEAVEKSEKDSREKLYSEAVKKSEKSEKSAEKSVEKSVEKCEKSAEQGLVNGDHREGSSREDKTQPTILSMFGGGRGGGQYRRLGMRGRVVQTPSDPDSFSPPRSPEPSPEPRRSPRKSTNGARPVAVAASPRKQNGVMTPSVSPARPDEFPSHAVSKGSSTGPDHTVLDSVGGEPSPHKSPASAQVWDMEGLDSPNRALRGKKKPDGASGVAQTEAEDSDSTTEGAGNDQDELPDLVPTSGDSDGGLLLSKGVTSPVKSRLEKMLASQSKSAGVASPVRPNSLPPSPRGGVGGSNPPPSSKLMIKLEKCDHLCNTPTISASAALKALKGPTNTCRKMEFGENDYDDDDDDNNNEQDSDEDEVSLGTKSSFKSVPLKSVCVKVEKCDTVCDSPDKSVSARFATSCLARQRAQRFNMIEKLFQGTMMMRTKCLECERSSERKECFQDVSVPLSHERSAGSDSESDEEKDSSLLRLMRAFTDVERLRDDNKYYCEKCYRYVEAERSLHYESLPNILTVHLKRFSATGMFGCLSKINDYVTVPLLLSCLRYKCPKPCVRPDHRYTLYAIVTHAGSTISAGHYLSYIKVRPNAVGHETLSSYLHSPSPSPPRKNNSRVDGIFDSPPPSSHHTDCATEKQRRDSPPLRKSHAVSERGDSDVFSCSPRNEEGLRQPTSLDEEGERAGESRPADYHWLECDDETIHILSEKEFHGRLLEREGALRGTPYVLFYHRLDTWNAK